MKRWLAAAAAILCFTEAHPELVPQLTPGLEAKQLEQCRKAAECEDYDAMYDLAYYNEHGIGMPVNIEEALKWYRRLCKNPCICGSICAFQYEAAKAIDRLVGLRIPFDPQTADGNTLMTFIASRTNDVDTVAVARVLRQKSVERTLVFTNLVVNIVQRFRDGGVLVTLSQKTSNGVPVWRRWHPCMTVQAMFDGASAQTARCLEREDAVTRLEGIAVTNNPWYGGIVLKGLSVAPKDPLVCQPLPDFDAATITGDGLLEFLKSQNRPIHKWQYSEIQSRLVGRRLTFSRLRLAGRSGDRRRMDDSFWIGAVPNWERVGEGDQPGSAEFRLSFGDDKARRFAMRLSRGAHFSLLNKVTGTFAKVDDPDDGWAFQLEDVDLELFGDVKDLAKTGDGSISGADLVRRFGAHFTPLSSLLVSHRLAGREVSFSAGVVESCRHCWENDTYSVVCRMTPWMSDANGGQPLRVAFEIPPERGATFRRTPIPGDLVVGLEGMIIDDENVNHWREDPVLRLGHPKFDITWKSDVAKLTGLDTRTGDRIVRRLSLCWREVRRDQFIRLARQVNGQTVKFSRGRFSHVYGATGKPQTVIVQLEDSFYGNCISLEVLIPEGELATRAKSLKCGTFLRNIQGVLVAEADELANEGMCVRLKDATFEFDEEQKRPNSSSSSEGDGRRGCTSVRGAVPRMDGTP